MAIFKNTVSKTGLDIEEKDEIKIDTEEESVKLRPSASATLSGGPSTRVRPMSQWRVFGKYAPRAQVVYLCQITIIFVIISVSLYNLTKGETNKYKEQIWLVLLSSCLGYVLPAPSLQPSNTGSMVTSSGSRAGCA